jgi:hypothetical protein
MFRYSLVMFAGLLLAGSAGAATWADGLFDELSKDFGSVPRGPTLQHPFHLVNKTKSTVHISGVRVSCNCTSATALKSTLAPGEDTVVQASMDTSRFSGVRTVTIYVQFDSPAAEEVRLWVQANSRDDVSVSPDTLAFGQTKRGSTPTSTVTVTFLGTNQAQITEVQSESNYISTTLKEVARKNTEVSYELTAKVRADTPVGKWYTDVWLKTNLQAMPKVRVPLTVEIESALSIGNVAFGQVKEGAEAERKTVVRGVKPFRITKVEGTDDEVTVRDSATDAKPVHVLTVTLKAAKAGDWSRTLKVVTDLGEEGEIEFEAKAQVVPADKP